MMLALPPTRTHSPAAAPASAQPRRDGFRPQPAANGVACPISHGATRTVTHGPATRDAALASAEPRRDVLRRQPAMADVAPLLANGPTRHVTHGPGMSDTPASAQGRRDVLRPQPAGADANAIIEVPR
jgi:hypothetical protein